MHELAVTESILSIATRYAQKENARQVTDIYIALGQLSSIVDDSVQFYWDIISQDSLCAGARLHFERQPARLLCLDCQKEYTLNGDLTGCPNCQSPRVKVIAGDEFQMDSIEITR